MRPHCHYFPPLIFSDEVEAVAKVMGLDETDIPSRFDLTSVIDKVIPSKASLFAEMERYTTNLDCPQAKIKTQEIMSLEAFYGFGV